MPATRVAVLVVSCVVLGLGVTFLLQAGMGSDGYSSLVNGVRLTTGIPFVVVNTMVGILLVAIAWLRGRRPGLGTVVQPLVVGTTIWLGLEVVPEPDAMAARIVLLVLAFVLMAAGVAAYLACRLGEGPAEAAALAWDPPVPFRWSYGVVQGGGALGGWLLGADIGIGTLAVIFGLGPAVDAILRRFPAAWRPAPTT